MSDENDLESRLRYSLEELGRLKSESKAMRVMRRYCRYVEYIRGKAYAVWLPGSGTKPRRGLRSWPWPH